MIQVKNDLRIAKRTDILTVNRILNHRDVRPTIGLAQNGAIDVSGTFDGYHVVLFSRSLFLVEPVDDFTVEAHVAVVPEDRGRCAIEAAMQVVGQLFTQSQIATVLAKTNSKEASAFARQVGFNCMGENERWKFWSLSVMEWAARFNPEQIMPQIKDGGQLAKFEVVFTRLNHLFREPEECLLP